MRLRALAALLVVTGCGELLGADFDHSNAGTGGGSSGDAATEDASGGSTEDAHAESCVPVSCYDGPPGTKDLGVCRSGTVSCSDGAPLSCEGQVLPVALTPAERCLLPTQDVDCDGMSGAHAWSKRFGGPQLQRVLHAAADPAGNVYLIGYTWGWIQLNAATGIPGSLYLIKLDPTGKVAWGKSWPTGQGVAVTPTPDGGVVLSAFLDEETDFGGGPVGNPDIDSGALVKFDASGAHVWTRPVGALVNYVRTRSDGKILFGGQVLVPPIWPSGSWPASTTSSAILGLLDSSGQPVWIQDYGVDVSVDRFAFDSQNAIWVASKTWGVRYFGDDEIGQPNTLTSFIAKLDPGGNPLWSRSLAPVAEFYERPALGVVESDDSVWVATPFSDSLELGSTSMTSEGASDIGVLHLSSTGQVLHSARFGDAADQHVWDATVDHDGHLVVTGSFIGSISAGPCSVTSHGDLFDAFMFKLDENANPVWMHAFGNDQDANFEGYPDDVFNAIGVTADNGIVVVGSFDGSTNFGGGQLTGHVGPTASDLIVARYAP